MGIFDVFDNSAQTAAANQQIQGITNGFSGASSAINNGITSLQGNYTAALQPYLTNYGQAQSGVSQLGNVLGLNGAAGNQSAMTALQNTPGYQFQLQQGDNAVNAAAAANGTLNSGNQQLALSNYNQGLASTTYNNYVSQLQPYLGASNSAAGGIAGVNTGLGNQLANQYDTLGNLSYTANTGVGNANANAALGNLTASGNIWGGISALASAAMGMPGMGGSFSGGTPGSAIPGSIGPTSFGGASGPTPLTGGSTAGNLFGSIFSDVRLKEDIEPVGELYDGTNIFRYRYKGDPVTRIGVMAQDVEKTRPDAVVDIGGYKAVDYSKATQYAADLSRFLEAA